MVNTMDGQIAHPYNKHRNRMTVLTNTEDASVGRSIPKSIRSHSER